MPEPLYFEVCRWIGDKEPHYNNEIIACGKRGQVIVTCDTLSQAQEIHARLATQGSSYLSLYFINSGEDA